MFLPVFVLSVWIRVRAAGFARRRPARTKPRTMARPPRFRTAVLACPLCLVLGSSVSPAVAFTHGWDTVGDMLGMNPHAAGNGRYNDSPFAMKHWQWVAENYAVLVLGRFGDFGSDFDPVGGYNCTCPMESSRVQVARILKKLNPKIKLLWYQNTVGDMTCTCCNEPLRSHPEWWMWDDHGNPITFGGACFPANATYDPNCKPYVNWTVPAAREWWYRQPLHEVCGQDAASLVDGMMMDGTMYSNPKDPQNRTNGGNLSFARYDAVFASKMLALEEGSQMYRDMNGGEVWGNPLVPATGPPHWGPRRPTDPPIDSYNRTLQHYDGGFVESFGAFEGIADEWGECITGEPGGPPGHQVNCTGEWDVLRTRTIIYAARNATMFDKKSVCFHAFPGPAGAPLGGVNGTAPTHPSPPHNSLAGEVVAAGWYGPKKAPWQSMKAPEYTPLDVVNSMKQASADMLVQSLAPFLIMAEETSFFGYGWFYDIETGYAPCDDNRTLCLAPDGWYPEFSKPLGPPRGPAVESGNVWTREFAHASVFIDITNRSLSRIDWSPPPTPAA